jgi:hypothetical protein
MIYLVNENTGAVWIEGASIKEAVLKVSEMENKNFGYIEVSKFVRDSLAGKDRNWYFSVFEGQGEYFAADAVRLAEEGQFRGYISLYHALAIANPTIGTCKRPVGITFEDAPAVCFWLSIGDEYVETAEWLDDAGSLLELGSDRLTMCHPELSDEEILQVRDALKSYLVEVASEKLTG